MRNRQLEVLSRALSEDIIAQEKAELQLKRHSDYLRLLIDTVLGCIFAKDIDGGMNAQIQNSRHGRLFHRGNGKVFIPS